MITSAQFDALYKASAQKLFSHKRTKIGPERLKNCGERVLDVNVNSITGDIVECGTYKGGALAFMALVNQQLDSARRSWGFDTFAGLPLPSQEDGPKAKGRGHQGDLEASVVDCEDTFGLIGAEASRITLVKGLFQDTLPVYRDKIGAISVLRLDGDWYDSTMCCLNNLYDQVSTGGWIIIDDYGHWPGCKRAVDEFLSSRGIEPKFVKTDYTEVFWKK